MQNNLTNFYNLLMLLILVWQTIIMVRHYNRSEEILTIIKHTLSELRQKMFPPEKRIK